MLDRNSKVAIVLDNRVHLEMTQTSLIKAGLNKVVLFQSVDEAYEVLSRQQVDLIVVGIKMPDRPGVTLMQRLMTTGNYSFEPFFFIGEKVDNPTLELFLEYDVDYVLTPPIDPLRLGAKIALIIERESNVPEDLQLYRDAKGAFNNNIFEMAKDFASQLLDNEKLSEKAKILMGDISFQEGDLDGAIKFFTEVLGKNPNSVQAIHKLSKIYMKQSNFELAKKYLDKVIDSNPHHINLLENTGLTNCELGFCDLATKQMNRLSELDETNKVSSEVITKVKIKEGNFDGVAAQLKKSHTEKEMVSLLNNAGVKLSKGEDYEGAIAIYKDCLETCRKKEFIGKISYNLAVAYRRLNDIESAKKYCQKSIDAYPELGKAKKMQEELIKAKRAA